MSEQVKAVLFDVDGTLIDSSYLHAVSWWEAFTQADHEVPMAQIHRAIGMGSDQILDALLPDGRDKDADAGIIASHGALHSVYWARLRPLPGAAWLMRACHQHGLRVVLASSAGPGELAVMRKAIDADDVIDAATTPGDADHSKPAPDLVQVALEKEGLRPAEAVFVGDAVWDVKACQRAGVTCIGVLSGGISRQELLAAGALRVYQDPAEILSAFPASLLAGKAKA
ncbi:MAG: HAD family hydrolase [Actinomycetota bacterium]